MKLPVCAYQYRDRTPCTHSAKYHVQWAPFVGRKLCSVHVYVGIDEGIAAIGRTTVTLLEGVAGRGGK